MKITRQIIWLFAACCSLLPLCPVHFLSAGAELLPGGEKASSTSVSSLKTERNDPFRGPQMPDSPESNQGEGSPSVHRAYTDCNGLEQSEDKPGVAIIIDDMGQDQHIGDKLMALDLNLTFSFLPYAPFTPQLEAEAWNRGHDILVHMPMEPKDPQWDPGPGALYVQDSPDKLAEAAENNLARVPHAIGVNNHMGSLFTENRSVMRQFLSMIAGKGMFFIDSVTSGESVGMAEAQEMGIRTAKRNVFLDNIRTQEDICSRLKELICIAREQGGAIGIGHANETTVMALDHCRETLLEYVAVVGIHELVE